MPNPIVHWEIQTDNTEKVQEFFAKLFDWHVDTDNPYNYGMVDTHADGGINGGIGPAGGGVNRVTFYVQVEDLQAFLDKAEGLGGKTVMPRTVIPDVVTIALFTDPDGNVIGMVEG